MRSFPDDKLPLASITAESLSINITCIFPSPCRTVELTHFTLTRVNLTRKVSYLLSSFPGVFPPLPAAQWKFLWNAITSTGGSLTCYHSFFSIVMDTIVFRRKLISGVSFVSLNSSFLISVTSSWPHLNPRYWQFINFNRDRNARVNS